MRSALVAIITLPIAIIMSFIPLYGLGLTSNIMSLGGIAIAIGAKIDAARFRWLTILLSVLVLGLTWIPFTRLGKEFMPPLNEGTLLYMPTAIPGMSMAEATKILQIQDRILRQFPEVEKCLWQSRPGGHINRSCSTLDV